MNKKYDYKIVDLDSEIMDLRILLDSEHNNYSKKISRAYVWTEKDFLQIYEANKQLLQIVEKQNDMIKNLYEILARHESGLG